MTTTTAERRVLDIVEGYFGIVKVDGDMLVLDSGVGVTQTMALADAVRIEAEHPSDFSDPRGPAFARSWLFGDYGAVWA